MAYLYADENFPLIVVKGLRELGHDVLTAREAGRANQGIDDDMVLNFAISQNRAVLTNNRRHFFRLHIRYPKHAGIIICKQDQDYLGQVERIDKILNITPSLDGVLIRVIRPQR